MARLDPQSFAGAVLPRVEGTLGAVGRMKYLRPLYTALLAEPATKEIATRAFRQHRASYHPIAQQMVQGLL
jgi:leukotriene-A4 hydrolase